MNPSKKREKIVVFIGLLAAAVFAASWTGACSDDDGSGNGDGGVDASWDSGMDGTIDPEQDATAVPIDFADETIAATPHTASITLSFPERADSPLAGADMAYANIQSRRYDFACVGHSTFGDVGEVLGTYDMDVEWIESPLFDPGEIVTRIHVWKNSAYSALYLDGYPTEGQHVEGFLDIPRMLSPSESGVAHPIDEPLEWEVFDEDVVSYIKLSRGPEAAWQVFVWDGSTTFSFPEPPSNVDKAAYLGSSDLEGFLQIYKVDPTTGDMVAGSYGEGFPVDPMTN